MSQRIRLDQLVLMKGLAPSRSQAESLIKLGKVTVDGKVVKKPGTFVTAEQIIKMKTGEQYVSRAGLKLASVAESLGVDFAGKVVLDVGSSTGGFTDYALRKGARKVIAVDVGTNQMHPTLRDDARIELHEQTDIRAVKTLSTPVGIVVIDVSFISLRDILPHIASIAKRADIIAMVKPQFEAGDAVKHKGVIKNDSLRRQILKDFELWAKQLFVIKNKADSQVAGAKGNRERFYLLRIVSK